jgi:hypothetical protein
MGFLVGITVGLGEASLMGFVIGYDVRGYDK